MNQSNLVVLDVLAKVLLRCWVVGVVFLLLNTLGIILGHDLAVSTHSRLFGLDPHELEIAFYFWLGTVKLLVVVLFFIPWIAVRLCIRQIRNS